MYKKSCVIFVLFICFASTTSENDAVCVTPNGESAKCVPIDSCPVLKQAITSLEDDAIDFAKQSRCGHDGGPLVCCGSSGRFVTEVTETPTGGQNENVLLSNINLCGIQSKQSRIVGGTVADLDEFPWMAILKYTKNDGSFGGFRCAGSLINQNFVLTAAQCLDIPGYELTEVRLGEWNISSTKDCVSDTVYEQTCADPVKDIKITEQIPHPFYSRQNGNNDIALLRLEEKVQYTDYIRPICIPPSDLPTPPTGTIMDISGWGFTESGIESDVKLKVKVPLVENQKCLDVFPNSTYIQPNQACAGGVEGKDACNGDSGAPLMRTYLYDERREVQWLQEGIVYRGVGCGKAGVPALYTRVSRYNTWITNTVK